MNSRHDHPVFADDATTPVRARRTVLQIIRRRPLAVMACVLASLAIAAIYIWSARPAATATARICVQPGGPKILTDAQPLPASVAPYNYVRTQCAVIKSTPVLSRALQSLRAVPMKTLEGARDPVELLSRSLRVEPGQGDLLISIALDSANPGEAIQVVNAVVDAYIAWQADQRKAGAAEVLASLAVEKAKWQAQVEEKNQALASFRSVNRTPTLDGERVKSVIHQLSNLEEQLTEARMDTMAAAAAFEAVKASTITPTSIADLPEYQQNRADLIAIDRDLTNLRATRDEQEARLAALADKYSTNHPTVQLAQTMIEQLTARIAAQEKHLAEASVTAAQSRVNDCKQHEVQLQTARAEQESTLATLQGQAAEYARLEADLARTTRLCDSLDDRIKELDIARDVGPVSASVLEWASVPDRDVWPHQVRTAAMALAMGLVLGITLAALRDASDRRFRSSDEVVAELNLPVLGVVPHVAGAYHGLGRLETEWPPAAAAYGVARAAMELAPGRGAGRTVVVTSADRGEGRTAVAVNLAVAMAQAQERVLLIDGNFHAGTLHEIFGIGNEFGLSTVLSGNEPVDHLISPTGVHRLDVLPAGTPPSNPSVAFGGERMYELLKELSHRYDRIVVDSPQVGDLPDARMLAAMAEATVLVVRANRSSRAQTALAVDALTGVGAHLVGVVVHGAPRQSAEEAASGWCCCGGKRNTVVIDGVSLTSNERQAPSVAAA